MRNSFRSEENHKDYKKMNCTVKKVIFTAEDSLFTVASVVDDDKKRLTACGAFKAEEGDYLTLVGAWTTHPTYGKQFGVKGAFPPESVKGYEKYLAKHAPHVGETTAKMIVDRFGEKTSDIIVSDYMMLTEIPRITEEYAKDIHEMWMENFNSGIARTVRYFASIGFSKEGAISRIYEKYGDSSIDVVQSNPYILADEVNGIGFMTADEIARDLGIDYDDMRRIRAGVKFSLKKAAESQGHVFLQGDELADAAIGILKNVNISLIRKAANALVMSGDIVMSGTRFYLKSLYKKERELAEDILEIRDGNLISSCENKKDEKQEKTEEEKEEKSEEPVSEEEFRDAENEAKKTTPDLEYDSQQKQAIDMACSQHISVITGGPGVGKTTIIRAVIHILKGRSVIKDNNDLLLAAPTGKAAKRMSEATGYPAKTIHRLLCYDPRTGFGYDRVNKLSGRVLIIDEASMIDVELAHALMQAVPAEMKVIFVGDVDQLPSVGPGSILKDIIRSGAVAVTRLNCIHRQAEKSGIIVNAHRINEGLPLSPKSFDDFMFIQADGQEEIAKKISELAGSVLPVSRMYSSNDIQVLCPMKKGACGVSEMNLRLQELFNKDGKKIPSPRNSQYQYRKGDRIMQIRNNYELGVFNGEVGEIRNGTEASLTAVYYDGDNSREVIYEKDNRQDVMLSYACTIHKSQGSEYRCVIIPVTMGNWILLQRSLLYTAVTRAKELCILVGEPRALKKCIETCDSSKRNTTLADYLRELKSDPREYL